MQDDKATVTTQDGCFKGILTAGVCKYSCIPYAEPATGPQRFKEPRALRTPASPFDATISGLTPLQNPSRLRTVIGDLEAPQSEDCLSLTVWAPEAVRDLKPVLLWLHGGAFLSGGGAVGWYDGATLCQEGDVVAVSPNYRLGALGFLHSPGVCKGNLGLLDAELALAWVRDNITRFGGDPHRITVMGQSAGAWLATLMAARMPSDSPTFKALILLSAPLGIPAMDPATAKTVASSFLAEIDAVTEADGRKATVQTASAKSVLKAQGAAIQAVAPRITKPGYPALPFGPVAEGSVLPLADEYQRYLVKAAGRLPVLIGWTRDEMRAFNPVSCSGEVDQDMQRVADEVFVNPSLEWASNAQGSGKDTFVFQFDWAPDGNPYGACHCIELPFVFGTFDAHATAPMLKGTQSAPARDLARRVRAAWLAFVTRGDPNAAGPNGLPAWPKFTAEGRQVMFINVQSKAAEDTRVPSRALEPSIHQST